MTPARSGGSTASGGTPNGTYAARVQFGDGTDTVDATASSMTAEGNATISGRHTFATPGTYAVRLLTSDTRSDVLTTLTVTVQ